LTSEKIVESVKKGVPKAETARRFGVDRATVKRYCKRFDECGTLEPGKAPGRAPKLDEKARKLLLEYLRERPWATHSQRAEFLLAACGLSVSEATIDLSDAQAPLAQPKKRSKGATERDEFLRLLWPEELGHIDAERLVFVDEMGTHTSLAPLYAYSPVGHRAFFQIPRNRGTNTTLLTSLQQGGMGPSMAVQGATTARVFETYTERLLAPSLREGQVVVMDNLGAHRPKRVREIIEARGCELIYLPPYSPDLNPIEEALSKIKQILRKMSARTKDALIEAMDVALEAVSARDAGGFFASCGYRTPAQQL